MPRKTTTPVNNSRSANFSEQCYALLVKVPPGFVTSYGEIARALGSKAYRAVGNAMNKNPNAPRVPCHRVVSSSGAIGGYAFGINKKKSLLRNEGIIVKNNIVTDFERVFFRFKTKANKKK